MVFSESLSSHPNFFKELLHKWWGLPDNARWFTNNNESIHYLKGEEDVQDEKES